MTALQLAVFGAVYAALHGTASLGLRLPIALEAAAASAVTVLAYDLATWVAHWLAHRTDLLWRFHAIHHSATELNLFTLYRDHPVDQAFRNVLRGVFTGAALALFHRICPRGTWGVELLGMGVGFLIYMPTVHLHHSAVPIRYPRWLGSVLLSPHLHHLHHSRGSVHGDRNFGVIFPFWDRLFGTLHDERFERGALEFGLRRTDPYRHSVLRCYLEPFRLGSLADGSRTRAARIPQAGTVAGGRGADGSGLLEPARSPDA
jgi:sterol desaturase/sphingolipid hydroxylase (fatty acid hydroxylase superfamily)